MEKSVFSLALKKTEITRIKINNQSCKFWNNFSFFKFCSNESKIRLDGGFNLKTSYFSHSNLFGMHSKFLVVIIKISNAMFKNDKYENELCILAPRESVLGETRQYKFKKKKGMFSFNKIKLDSLNIGKIKIIFFQNSVNKKRRENRSILTETFRRRLIWNSSLILKKNKNKKRSSNIHFKVLNFLFYQRIDLILVGLKSIT
jgi:hypothetical protein